MNRNQTTADHATHLFLDGSRKSCLVMLEGKALRIWQEDRNPFLHPLRRLDRITSTGNVWWQSAALSTIAQNGTPLGILDGEGRLKAMLMPYNLRRSSFSDELNRFIKNQDWQSRLEDWRINRISLIAARLKLDNPLLQAKMGWSGAEKILMEIARMPPAGLGRAKCQRLSNHARSFAQLLARTYLQNYGCPASWLGSGPFPKQNLTSMMSQVILWMIVELAKKPGGERRLLEALGKMSVSSEPALRRAEQAAAILRPAIHDQIIKLHEFLLEENSSHKYIPE